MDSAESSFCIQKESHLPINRWLLWISLNPNELVDQTHRSDDRNDCNDHHCSDPNS